MNAYLDIFEVLPINDHVKYSFSDQKNTILIYAFFKYEIVSPLDVLEQLNDLARKYGLCEFWLKKAQFLKILTKKNIILFQTILNMCIVIG